MNGHGQEFGHEFVSEADSDTRFFRSSDADSDTRFLRTSETDMDLDKVMTSDTSMSENLGHGLGHGKTSDTRVRSSLPSVGMKLSLQYNPKNLFRSEICVDNFSPN